MESGLDSPGYSESADYEYRYERQQEKLRERRRKLESKSEVIYRKIIDLTDLAAQLSSRKIFNPSFETAIT